MLGAQVERVTNHDVKAIEYVIKRRLQGNAELARVSAPRASATHAPASGLIRCTGRTSSQQHKSRAAAVILGVCCMLPLPDSAPQPHCRKQWQRRKSPIRPRASSAAGPWHRHAQTRARRCSSSRTLRAPARTSTTWRTRWRCARRASATCCPPWTRRAPALSDFQGCRARILHRACWLCLSRPCFCEGPQGQHAVLGACCGHGGVYLLGGEDCADFVGSHSLVQKYGSRYLCNGVIRGGGPAG